MNKKWKNNLKIYGSISLVTAIIATTTSICVTNVNANTNYMLNSTAKNSTLYTNNEQSQPIAEPKMAVDGDFLLNRENAIDMPNKITALTSTSTTNGPRGFLVQVGNNINYIGYDGKTIIWSIQDIIGTQTGAGIISSHYNAFANCFVVLYVASGNIRITSILETNGIVINADAPYSHPYDINNIKRFLLVPIYETNNTTVRAYWCVAQFTNIDKNMLYYSINDKGTLIYESSKSGIPNVYGTSSNIWLAAGAVNYDGNIYTAITLIFSNKVYLLVFKNLVFKNANYVEIALTEENKWIDTNIPEIHMKFNPTNTSIAITTITNANISQSTIISSSLYYINSPDSTTIFNINLQQPGILDYDIYKGRFYGDYLYAYLNYADYGQSSPKLINKIMRLNLSDQRSDGNGTWNTAGLRWDGTYTNERIVLYDYTYDVSPNDLIAQPLYQADNNYSAFPNIFAIANSYVDLRYFDGTKRAYAYETKTKNNIYDFAIRGVADILVEDANSNLNTYFTNTMFSDNFTQYQSGSTYTITKKTGADDIIENKKGNIPATLVIAKGYDNNSFAPVAKSIDIVLTGFKEAPKATDIQNTSAKIDLLDVYPYQIQPTTTPIIKDFIIKNILTGEVAGITVDNVLSYAIDSYNNKDGILILKSITLNKWYDENGIVQDTDKSFTLANDAGIEINGFKKVEGPTSAVANIAVTGDLTLLTTSRVTDKQLLTWVNANKNSVFLNLPPEVKDILISNIRRDGELGEITINVSTTAFYDSNNFCTYVEDNKILEDIKLTNFVPENWATTTQVPTASVTGQLAITLPQFITRDNVDFKQYLFDNVIVDPTKKLSVNDINDFTGKYDNTTGTYTLISITMSKIYNQFGIEIYDYTFSSLSYPIHGLRSIITTAPITTPLVINAFATTSVLDATNTMIENWLKTGTNFSQAFIANSLPDNFSASNIVSVSIVDNSTVPSTGSLKVKLVINNYYEGIIGTLTIADSNPFELTISGFKIDSLATSVNVDPTAIAPYPNAINIFAESITFAATDFKEYLFNYVLIDPSKTLTIDNLINIVNIVTNNISGTLTFNLQVNKRTNVDGNTIDGDFIFTNNITIKGFKKITATDVISSINLGDNTILANDVTQEQYTKTVRDNYLKIFESLPDNFDPNTNILYVDLSGIDEAKGELDVVITINLYYAPITGLITTSPTTFALNISGYKTTFISIKNRFDITRYNNEYKNQISGAVLLKESGQNGASGEMILTNWLRNPVVFKSIIPDSKDFIPDDFSISKIIKIDNNLGEISATLAVVGGNFFPSEDQITFYGFRESVGITTWLDKVKSSLVGNAASTVDQTNDIKNQIIKLSKNNNSPFNNALTANDIDANYQTNTKSFEIIINSNGYVDDNNIYIEGKIPFVAKYQFVDFRHNVLEDWVYPVIFSIVGLIIFLILIWVIIVIIKRSRKNLDISND